MFGSIMLGSGKMINLEMRLVFVQAEVMMIKSALDWELVLEHLGWAMLEDLAQLRLE